MRLSEEFLLQADPSRTDVAHRTAIVVALGELARSRVLSPTVGMLPADINADGSSASFNEICWNLVCAIGYKYGNCIEKLDQLTDEELIESIRLGRCALFQWEWALNAVRQLFDLTPRPNKAFFDEKGEPMMVPSYNDPDAIYRDAAENCGAVLHVPERGTQEGQVKSFVAEMPGDWSNLAESRYEKIALHFPPPHREVTVVGLPGKMPLMVVLRTLMMQAFNYDMDANPITVRRANGDKVDLNVPLAMTGVRDGDVLECDFGPAVHA